MIESSDGSAPRTADAPLDFDAGAPLAPPPTVTVDPSEGLTDGQSITVTVDGMVWSSNAVAILCRAGATGSNDCDFSTFSFFTVGPDGSGSTQLTVAAVLDVQSASVDCREPGACIVVVTPDSGRTARKTGIAPLAFDPETEVVAPTLAVTPDQDLVDGQTVTVTGSGYGGGPGFVELLECPADPTPGGCAFVEFTDNVGADGSLTLDVQVSAILVGDTGSVDCRTSPEPCLLVATAGSVTSPHAGRAPLAFRPDGPLVPGPTVTLDPESGLPDQATVTVTGSGFTEEGFASVQVCRTGDQSACDPETNTGANPDNHGAFTLALGVAATFNTDADQGGEAVDCRAAPGCEVVATDFGGPRTRRGSASLDFAPATAPGRTRFLDPVFDDVDVTENVAYRTTTGPGGQPVTLTADIYQPAGDTAATRPALVWFPGGWFRAPESGDVAPAYAEAFARRGYVVVVMDYRQRPALHCCPTDDATGLTAAFVDAYGDATAGVAWLRDHGADYRIDTRAIAAGGSEAGAATALHLADLPGQVGITGSPSVKAAVGIGGVDLGRHDAGEAPTLALNSSASTPAPHFLAEWACDHSRRVGVVCETAGYDGVFGDIASVRQRDATRRTSRFLVDAMLAPLGLAAPTGDSFTPVGSAAPDPAPSPAPSATPAATAAATTTTASAQAQGTLPQTGANATATLLRVGLVLAAVGVVLVALARARRRSDAGRLGLTGAVAVVISAVVVASLIATACSKCRRQGRHVRPDQEHGTRHERARPQHGRHGGHGPRRDRRRPRRRRPRR